MNTTGTQAPSQEHAADYSSRRHHQDQMTATIEARQHAPSSHPTMLPAQTAYQQQHNVQTFAPSTQQGWTSVAPSAYYATPHHQAPSMSHGIFTDDHYQPQNLTHQEQQALLFQQFPPDAGTGTAAGPSLSYESTSYGNDNNMALPASSSMQSRYPSQAFSHLATRSNIDLSPYQEAHFPNAGTGATGLHYLPVSASSSSMASTSLATPATPFPTIAGTPISMTLENVLKKWHESEAQAAVRKGQALQVFSTVSKRALGGKIEGR